ncbi:MAG: hypothetical protein HYZ93_01415 [Candidatus Omnitrophica bacterium]|nr:hypothetical protein [Candidatus Omnitrophota bacterium]
MKNPEAESERGKQVHRVVTFLDRQQVDYLDKLGKDALFSTGMKFPRTRVISTLIDLLRKANVNGDGLRSDQDLEDRLLKKLASGVPDAKRLAGELMEDNRASSSRVRG